MKRTAQEFEVRRRRSASAGHGAADRPRPGPCRPRARRPASRPPGRASPRGCPTGGRPGAGAGAWAPRARGSGARRRPSCPSWPVRDGSAPPPGSPSSMSAGADLLQQVAHAGGFDLETTQRTRPRPASRAVSRVVLGDVRARSTVDAAFGERSSFRQSSITVSARLPRRSILTSPIASTASLSSSRDDHALGRARWQATKSVMATGARRPRRRGAGRSGAGCRAGARPRAAPARQRSSSKGKSRDTPAYAGQRARDDDCARARHRAGVAAVRHAQRPSVHGRWPRLGHANRVGPGHTSATRRLISDRRQSAHQCPLRGRPSAYRSSSGSQIIAVRSGPKAVVDVLEHLVAAPPAEIEVDVGPVADAPG